MRIVLAPIFFARLTLHGYRQNSTSQKFGHKKSLYGITGFMVYVSQVR